GGRALGGERVLARGALHGLAEDGLVEAQLALAARARDDFGHGSLHRPLAAADLAQAAAHQHADRQAQADDAARLAGVGGALAGAVHDAAGHQVQVGAGPRDRDDAEDQADRKQPEEDQAEDAERLDRRAAVRPIAAVAVAVAPRPRVILVLLARPAVVVRVAGARVVVVAARLRALDRPVRGRHRRRRPRPPPGAQTG